MASIAAPTDSSLERFAEFSTEVQLIIPKAKRGRSNVLATEKDLAFIDTLSTKNKEDGFVQVCILLSRECSLGPKKSPQRMD